MNAGLGVGITLDANGLSRTLTRTCISLSSLPSDRQAPKVALSTIGFDCLQPLEIDSELPAQVAFDNVLTLLN